MRDIRSIIRRTLLSVFLLALIVGTGAFYFVLHDRAVRQAEEQARTLLAAALAVRGYTTEHILPRLSRLPSDGFLEETAPSFAAQTATAILAAAASLRWLPGDLVGHNVPWPLVVRSDRCVV